MAKSPYVKTPRDPHFSEDVVSPGAAPMTPIERGDKFRDTTFDVGSPSRVTGRKPAPPSDWNWNG